MYFHEDSEADSGGHSGIGGCGMLRLLLVDERGTETVEWGLIAGLIVGDLVLILIAVGVWLKSRMKGLQTELGA